MIERIRRFIRREEQQIRRSWEIENIEIPEHMTKVEMDKKQLYAFSRFYRYTRFKLKDKILIFAGDQIFWCKR